MKVSFDFDSTLDRLDVQDYAKLLIEKGFEVYIVTSRLSNKEAPSPSWNDDLYKVAKDLGIKEENIIFTCYKDKSQYFMEHPDIIFHLDDDYFELKSMSRLKCNTVGISVLSTSYVSKCNRILAKKGLQ